MNTVQEYRNPLLIAVGAIVIAIILYVAVIAPQGTKLNSLKAQETTLQAQQATLQAQLTTLQTEKHQLSAHCADLEKIATQIPSVASASDLAAEQSSFYDQLTALVSSSGTSIPAFSWTGSTATGTTATTPTTPGAATGASTTAGVTPVPVSMQITGNYGQMSAFVAGLDSFPRLFVIQTFTLSFNSTTGTGATATVLNPLGTTNVGSEAPALWTGGTATAPPPARTSWL